MKVNDIITESASAEQLTEEFDLIESIINRLAQHNGVDAETIWEDLETLTEDELYAFAVTSEPIMESQGVAEGFGGGAAGFLMGIPLAAMTTIVGLLFGTSAEGTNVFLGTMALSTALGSWLQNKMAEADNKINSYRSKKIFSVFVNGEKISTNLMDYASAGKMIANLAKKEHDPNTYFTIYDNEAEEISWRFQIKDDNREDDEVEESIDQGMAEDWQKANKRDKTDGMSQKAVNAYRRENPGSKLKTAVTTKPSKLKRGSKASKRRKSYCSRSRGQMKMHSISCAKTPDKAICKARRRWNC